MISASQINPAERILMGPGPSTVPHRVLRAMSAPTLGHLDPQYLAIMDETCEMLRIVLRTADKLTFPVSGTGMAGMECIATNLLERGDEAIVCVNGVFGARMKDVMERCGATVHAVEAPWGDIISREQIAAALDAHPKVKLLGIVHAETSTGAHQPLDGLANLCHDKGALLVVDAVTSLGGHDLRTDDWSIAAIYSGTQKCLSCPPGLSPVSFGERALAVMDSRKTKHSAASARWAPPPACASPTSFTPATATSIRSSSTMAASRARSPAPRNSPVASSACAWK
jgi:alanine-glyoxylate transaminase/serine-glyoxylate transaminase/serine-pyruvate transaminase